MSNDTVLNAVAREFASFSLSDSEEEANEPFANHCEHAQRFAQWVESTLNTYIRVEPDVMRVAQAKVLLLDRYYEWRVSVPKSHRNRIADNGHICIFHIFERAYRQIKLAELSLTTPLLFLRPTPPVAAAPRPIQIAGITLGEIVDGE